ncbi:MAG: endonuclease/exonuclease/phosphatase family protein [Flavobacterium sp.]|nr:endonuclease/exonuclease/phosphatase family protein [Flavobacterium sp.]
MKYFFVLLFLLPIIGFAQQKNMYKVALIAFYNCENFYDTTDNLLVNDDEFTPKGPRNYNSKIYWSKVEKLATVISQLGTDVSPDGPAILGVAEIENDTVLNDLIHHPLLKNRNYKFVHYDSRDARGVDVALLYNPKYFTPLASKALFVALPGGSKDAYYTRDILWVKGNFDGEIIHVLVNHWPSRLGGEERSAPSRAAAAAVCKAQMAKVAENEPNAKFVIMGDLNDDPTSPSITKVLNAKANAEEVQPGGIFNPWINFYKKGIGTLAYQDAWSLFDQIIITYPWLNKNQKGYTFYRQYIFNKEFLVENIGKYKGYPMRTWDGLTYRGGYSDHFPTYLMMVKKIN